MSKDKVPNVRIKYLQCFPDLMKKMNKSKETENYFEAMNILSLLKEDLDLDVSEVIQIINIPNQMAYRAEIEMLKFPPDIAAIDEEEKIKLQFEKEQLELEKIELGRLKSDFVEEEKTRKLDDDDKMDFVNSILNSISTKKVKRYNTTTGFKFNNKVLLNSSLAKDKSFLSSKTLDFKKQNILKRQVLFILLEGIHLLHPFQTN